MYKEYDYSVSQSASQSQSQSEEDYSSNEYQMEPKKVTRDGVTYLLSEYDYTAVIIDCDVKDDIFEVPSNLEDGEDLYTIISIGPRAFKNTNIKELTFKGDSSICSFGKDSLFCHTLQAVSFPYQLMKLEPGWCYFTLNLSKIKIIEGNRFFIFDDGVLYNKKKTVLHFCSRKKKAITIPSSVKKIASYAFEQCRKLESVQFEDQSSLEEIQSWAFSRSHIRSITVPKNVTNIHSNAFFWCKRLRELKFEDGSQLLNIHHAAFKDTLLSNVTLPETTSTISKNAFQNCNNLSSLKIFHHGDLFIDKGAFKGVNENFVLEIHTKTELKGNGYQTFLEKIHRYNDS